MPIIFICKEMILDKVQKVKISNDRYNNVDGVHDNFKIAVLNNETSIIFSHRIEEVTSFVLKKIAEKIDAHSSEMNIVVDMELIFFDIKERSGKEMKELTKKDIEKL